MIFRVVTPLSAQMLILLGVFLIMVAYHARLVEVTSRLDFLWKQQAERELADMEETKQNNMQLLTNILPDHVAEHYLSNDRNSDVTSRDFLNVGFNRKFSRNCSPSTGRKLECFLPQYRISLIFIRKKSTRGWSA